MDRQQKTAGLVAEYLYSLGFKVNYPGLDSHPGKDIHERIADGNGAVLSFETGNKSLSEKIVAGTRLWGISVSFGCVNSLISMPCVMSYVTSTFTNKVLPRLRCLLSHASIDAATRAARGLPEDLIRLCVGIEDPTDLLDDLERALLDAGAIVLNLPQNKYVRATDSGASDSISQAVEKLGLGNRESEDAEWFVSAPGKVILFGEHAVVHGVVSLQSSLSGCERILVIGMFEMNTVPEAIAHHHLGPTGVNSSFYSFRLQLPRRWTSGVMALRRPGVMVYYQFILMTSITSITNGTSTPCPGTP